MNWKIFKQRTSLNIISAIILVVGLATAAFIYQRAGNLYSEGEDGTMRLIMPESSKLYRHNLELYGGKLNVMMDDFMRCFTGLWHGKSLAFIIALISIIVSFGFFYVANYLQEPTKPDGNNDKDPDGIG